MKMYMNVLRKKFNIDLTGAGDLFASGFDGYIKGQSKKIAIKVRCPLELFKLSELELIKIFFFFKTSFTFFWFCYSFSIFCRK